MEAPPPPPPPPPPPSSTGGGGLPNAGAYGGTGPRTGFEPPMFAAGGDPNHKVPLATRGTMVDMRVSCRNLASISRLPPRTFVVMFVKVSGKSDWYELGTSDNAPPSDNPQYRRLFQMEYRFELYQQLRVLVFERANDSPKLDNQTLLGAVDTTLGSVVSAQTGGLELSLINQSRGAGPLGSVLIAADEIVSAKRMISLELSFTGLVSPEAAAAHNKQVDALQAKAAAPVQMPSLPKRGAAALLNRFRKDERVPGALPAHLANAVDKQKSERAAIENQVVELQTQAPPPAPFFVLYRAPASATAAVDYNDPNIPWEEVFRSSHVDDYSAHASGGGGVRFKPVTLSEYDLTERDQARFLKLAVIDPTAGADAPPVMYHLTNFPALRRMCTDQKDVTLALNPYGNLTVHSYAEREESTFIDYIRGGWCDFGMVCAIDFTSSNGDPRRQGTRHFISPVPNGPPNEYEAAMRTVANMLASYSADERIPAYGFGANIPPKYNVSHCFPIPDPTSGHSVCSGVEDLVGAYRETLSKVQLYGPTIFSEVLRATAVIVSRRVDAAERAARATGEKKIAYTVLLILTDGVISDYDATVAELIRMSYLPLSVLIVGVGNEDFGKMYNLDASRGPLRRGTDFAAREFTQFVPYNEFKGDLSALAEKILRGIPDQVQSYNVKIKGEVPPQQ